MLAGLEVVEALVEGARPRPRTAARVVEADVREFVTAGEGGDGMGVELRAEDLLEAITSLGPHGTIGWE